MEEVVKKGFGRGRIAGVTKVITKIEDPLLGKYHIEVGDESYNVMEEGKKNPLGYYTSLTNALKKIAKLGIEKKATYTIQEYINEYKNLIEQTKHLINE